MSVSFLNTAFFWGFFSLLIPLAIHLFSKQKQKVVKVASTRFFDHEPSPRAHHISLSDKRLLLLRMLLLSLIILILADPYLQYQKEKEGEVIYLFDQRLLENESSIGLMADSLANKRRVKLELTWADYLKVNDFQSYDTVYIISYNQQQLLGTEPQFYPYHISWQLIDRPEPKIINAWQQADSLFIFHSSGKLQAVHLDDLVNYSEEFKLDSAYLIWPNQLDMKVKLVPEINLIYDLKKEAGWLKRAFNSLAQMRGFTWNREGAYVSGQFNVYVTDQIIAENTEADFVIKLQENSDLLHAVQFQFDQLMPLLQIDRAKLIKEAKLPELPELIWQQLQPFVFPLEEGNLIAEKDKFEAYYRYDSQPASNSYKVSQSLLLYLIILLMAILFTERWWAYKSSR